MPHPVPVLCPLGVGRALPLLQAPVGSLIREAWEMVTTSLSQGQPCNLGRR